MTTPFPRREITSPTDGACDAVSHSFENEPACQSALLIDAINFQAIGRSCNTATLAQTPLHDPVDHAVDLRRYLIVMCT
ncbi:hypothetical protein HU230_0001555 [Bradyrhizobium quebecense]|uniref:Uncharacterized protein n=1 Tax=Bradyrhizobium quebecense TaxID=2748629 RepID=A0A974AER7_9BRAD|nr:hypothetical protein [Bradyrhizobium quebecense]UGA44757.1 hypothetical protein HU230_0001555 [Bradyrhizobium quebecense]